MAKVDERPSGGISELPNELILEVFLFLEGLQTIISLACTSSIFHNTLRQNRSTIVDHVIKNTVLRYSDALRLAEAQRYALKESSTAEPWGPLGLRPGFHHPVFSPLQYTIYKENAVTMTMAQNHFLEHAVGPDIRSGTLGALSAGVGGDPPLPLRSSVRPHRDPPYLTLTEQARFAHAYYRIRLYAVYANYPADDVTRTKRDRFLSDIDIEEHWRYCDMIYFLLAECDADLQRLLFRDLDRPNAPGFIAGLLSNILEGYRKKLQRAGHTGMIPRHPGSPKAMYIAVFDCHQETLRQMAQDIYSGKRTDD